MSSDESLNLDEYREQCDFSLDDRHQSDYGYYNWYEQQQLYKQEEYQNRYEVVCLNEIRHLTSFIKNKPNNLKSLQKYAYILKQSRFEDRHDVHKFKLKLDLYNCQKKIIELLKENEKQDSDDEWSQNYHTDKKYLYDNFKEQSMPEIIKDRFNTFYEIVKQVKDAKKRIKSINSQIGRYPSYYLYIEKTHLFSIFAFSKLQQGLFLSEIQKAFQTFEIAILQCPSDKYDILLDQEKFCRQILNSLDIDTLEYLEVLLQFVSVHHKLIIAEIKKEKKGEKIDKFQEIIEYFSEHYKIGNNTQNIGILLKICENSVSLVNKLRRDPFQEPKILLIFAKIFTENSKLPIDQNEQFQQAQQKLKTIVRIYSGDYAIENVSLSYFQMDMLLGQAQQCESIAREKQSLKEKEEYFSFALECYACIMTICSYRLKKYNIKEIIQALIQIPVELGIEKQLNKYYDCTLIDWKFSQSQGELQLFIHNEFKRILQNLSEIDEQEFVLKFISLSNLPDYSEQQYEHEDRNQYDRFREFSKKSFILESIGNQVKYEKLKQYLYNESLKSLDEANNIFPSESNEDIENNKLNLLLKLKRQPEALSLIKQKNIQYRTDLFLEISSFREALQYQRLENHWNEIGRYRGNQRYDQRYYRVERYQRDNWRDQRENRRERVQIDDPKFLQKKI